MIPITPAEIMRILETTDRLGFHREAVTIPLAREDSGSVTLSSSGTRLEITAPADRPVGEWLNDLPALIGGLDLSRVRRNEGPAD